MNTMERKKTANQIIEQFNGIRKVYFKHLQGNTSYKNKARANMERASRITNRYLHNIANYFNMAVSLDTWKEIGDIKMKSNIYTR